VSRTILLIIAVILAVFLVVVACTAGYLIVRNLTQPSQPADSSWENVEKAGKMIVGTSADYPPYEYYVNGQQIDGFDIALMDEIGRNLGMQVEYRNFAFESLFGALQVNQIDAAIAAISITPERQAIVDFSDVYLVTEDSFLAQDNSPITDIASVSDIAPYRTGVQRGSVYESWLQTTLIDTGQMPASNLLSYEKIEDAVRDLRVGRLDLVVLDAQPALAFEAEGGVKVVGGGLNQQRLAIAVPKGATSLTEQLNRALTDLNNQGVIAQLASQYLDLDPDDLLPTPTPTPPQEVTVTPGPTPTCIDGLAFVQHLNYESQAGQPPPEMQPGQPFTKAWRVENTGTCTWDRSYHLVYVQGNTPASGMSGQTVPVARQVAPGEQYDIQVNLVAPANPGTYVGFWQMEDGANQAFGERLPVSIRVPGSATATPVPTQTPTPGITFTVDRTTINQGECVTFNWRVENVKAVYFYAQGENWQDNGVAGEGSRQECPQVTTTYLLRVVMNDDSVVEKQVTITVNAAPDAPVINQFYLQPTGQIELGQCVDIFWDVSGNTSNVTITANSVDLWNGAPVEGSLENCPPGAGQVTYAVIATGPGGTSQRQESINVVAGATATPVPTDEPQPTDTPAPEPTATAAPDQPVIDSFSANPVEVEVGACVDITWSTSGGTTWVTITKNDDALWDNAPLAGSTQDCPDAPGSVLYGIVAYNAVDETAKQGQEVTVVEPGPSNPLANTNWAATNFYDAASGGVVGILPGTALTASFGEGGDISGSSGCNDFAGNYSADGSSLNISAGSTTRLACEVPKGIMEQEAAYLSALNSAAGFSMEAGELYILDGSGSAIIEYVQR
jgi:polar amino acid transport system substrate-binding protein